MTFLMRAILNFHAGRTFPILGFVRHTKLKAPAMSSADSVFSRAGRYFSVTHLMFTFSTKQNFFAFITMSPLHLDLEKTKVGLHMLSGTSLSGVWKNTSFY